MFISTNYYSGVTDLGVLLKPVADVVVEELKGIKRCTHQEIQVQHGTEKLDWRLTQFSLFAAIKVTHTRHIMEMVRSKQ